jgi:hypothetical protein
MHIGLFIPRFIDAFFPEVGDAPLKLLVRFGDEVIYPCERDPTNCEVLYGVDPEYLKHGLSRGIRRVCQISPGWLRFGKHHQSIRGLRLLAR